MKEVVEKLNRNSEIDIKTIEMIEPISNNDSEAYEMLKDSVYTALETYSNVHRGSGHFSMVTTKLYDQAREIVLDYLSLRKRNYLVIFCSPAQAETIKTVLKPDSYNCLSSGDIGLSLGVRAMVIKKNDIPSEIPFQTGGGTARLIAPDWVIWARREGKFEAGTPSIINVITFARALQLLKHIELKYFDDVTNDDISAKQLLYHDKLVGSEGKELLDSLKNTLIGKNVLVPTSSGDKPFINFDNAASTPTFHPVWNTASQSWNLPTSVQKEVVTEVKNICSDFFCSPSKSYDVFFTSNTTEGINLVARNISKDKDTESEPVILNTMLEHNSNEIPWRVLSGFSLVRMPVDENGFIDLNELEKTLESYNSEKEHGKKRIKLMAISGSSNVLGVYNDLAKISEVVHRYGVELLVDAAQMAAHRKIEMDKLGIDYLVFSAHKMYAPFGSGSLIAKRSCLNFLPDEESFIKSCGEENISGIAAMGKAMVLLKRIGMNLIQEEETELTRYTLDKMNKIADYTIFGIKNPESTEMEAKGGVILFNHKKIMASGLAKKLAYEGGIGVRSGCHCSHMLIKKILGVGPGLEKFQKVMVGLLPKIELPGATRISFGIQNMKGEVDEFVKILKKIDSDEIRTDSSMKRRINEFAGTKCQMIYG